MEGIFHSTTYGDKDKPGIYPKDLVIEGALYLSKGIVDLSEASIEAIEDFIAANPDIPIDELTPSTLKANYAIPRMAGQSGGMEVGNLDHVLLNVLTDVYFEDVASDRMLYFPAISEIPNNWEVLTGSFALRVTNKSTTNTVTVAFTGAEIDQEIFGNVIIPANGMARIECLYDVRKFVYPDFTGPDAYIKLWIFQG